MKKTISLLLVLLFSTNACYGSHIERLIKKTEPKVVKIGIITDKGRGGCSGAFVTASGVVLTCAHCFEGNVKKVFIKTSTGLYFPAQPLLIDHDRDIALIAPINYMGKFKYFQVGKQPKVGQQVISLGSPLGMQGTATVGYVANILNEKKYTYVLHSAFVNPGNSGGPLVDMAGKLVGINEAMIQYAVFSIAQGLYVAISLKTIKEALNAR